MSRLLMTMIIVLAMTAAACAATSLRSTASYELREGTLEQTSTVTTTTLSSDERVEVTTRRWSDTGGESVSRSVTTTHRSGKTTVRVTRMESMVDGEMRPTGRATVTQRPDRTESLAETYKDGDYVVTQKVVTSSSSEPGRSESVTVTYQPVDGDLVAVSEVVSINTNFRAIASETLQGHGITFPVATSAQSQSITINKSRQDGRMVVTRMVVNTVE